MIVSPETAIAESAVACFDAVHQLAAGDKPQASGEASIPGFLNTHSSTDNRRETLVGLKTQMSQLAPEFRRDPYPVEIIAADGRKSPPNGAGLDIGDDALGDLQCQHAVVAGHLAWRVSADGVAERRHFRQQRISPCKAPALFLERQYLG